METNWIPEHDAFFIIDSLSQLPIAKTIDYLVHAEDDIANLVGDALGVKFTIGRKNLNDQIVIKIYGQLIALPYIYGDSYTKEELEEEVDKEKEYKKVGGVYLGNETLRMMVGGLRKLDETGVRNFLSAATMDDILADIAVHIDITGDERLMSKDEMIDAVIAKLFNRTAIYYFGESTWFTVEIKHLSDTCNINKWQVNLTGSIDNPHGESIEVQRIICCDSESLAWCHAKKAITEEFANLVDKITGLPDFPEGK